MHSTLFHIGPIPIRAYGLMLWIGIMVGLFRTIRAGKAQGIGIDHIIDITLISVVIGIICAHITSVILEMHSYGANPKELVSQWKYILVPNGGLRGLSFHGGLAGGIIAGYFYCRRKGLSFPIMLDLFAPAIPLAYGITRIGCFLNGCCYGIPTSLPWGVRFPSETVPGTLTPPSHPVQIYAFFISLIIYYILIRIEQHKKFVGQVFFSYGALYAVYRFFIEFLRKGVTAKVVAWGLTEAQIASIVMFVVSMAVLYYKLRPAKQIATN